MRAAGVPDGPAMGVALSCIPRAVKQLGREGALARLAEVAATPERFEDEVHFGALAQRLVADQREADRRFVERDAPAPFANYCGDADPGALDQMRNSLRLPSALRGALMPDAHRGYGLPIGGVLETEGTVIPYAVGVDIACRMKLSVLDLDPAALDDGAHLEQALLKQTQFGTGAKLRKRADHATMEDERWTLTPLAARLRDRASDQLGTSGSGNHFVEFGLLDPAGAGPRAARGPVRRAARRTPAAAGRARRSPGTTPSSRVSCARSCPRSSSYLSWLDLDHDSGREYLQLMRLMGDYASACHAVIHERVTGHLKAEVLAGVENHHNYAWTAERDGREVVVHRKGATPAAAGELGVIPGSMAAPGFVVRGKGAPDSIDSASHGAGRRMSRTAATQQFNWSMVRPVLEERGVKLLSAGIDENPFAYKDIETVMAAQTDLVDVVGRFDPRIVRMAEAGERPED